MTLAEMLYLREVKDNKKPETFLDDITVCDKVDKTELWSHICYEFGDMEVLPPTTDMFKKAVTGFFKHWNPKIEELAKTLEYVYDPLRDYYRNSDLNSERDVNRDYTRDFTNKVTTDHTDNITENTTAQETMDRDTTTHRTYKEDQTTSGRENVRVSAFNQEYAEETEKNWGQVPNYDGRDLTLTTTDVHTTGSEDGTGTEDYTKGNTKNVTSNEDEDTTQDSHADTIDNEVTDDDYKRHAQDYGTTRHSYQDLIQQQREVVQFDLCRWIMNKWAQDIMISVW